MFRRPSSVIAQIFRKVDLIMSGLTDLQANVTALQAAVAALQAEQATFLADVQAALANAGDADSAVEAVAQLVSAQTALLAPLTSAEQAADPGAPAAP